MALSKDAKNFIQDLSDDKLDGLVIGDREGLELLGKVMRRMESNASLIQWASGTDNDLNGSTANTIAVANGSAVESTLGLALTDLNNQLFDDAAYDYTIEVTASGAAANKEYSLDGGATWSAFSGALELTLVDGSVEFMVRADYSTNAMVLTLGNPSGGKSADGTLTITGS